MTDTHKNAFMRYAGGYPIIYLTERDECLCAACATSQEYGEPRYAGIHWEGAALECDGCGDEIESAYGEAEETES